MKESLHGRFDFLPLFTFISTNTKDIVLLSLQLELGHISLLLGTK